MGQKVHPYGFRVGIRRPWLSRWYARKKDYGRYLVEDQLIRKYIMKRLPSAAIALIEVERTGEETLVYIHTARPGVVIGKKGAEIDRLREELGRLVEGPAVPGEAGGKADKQGGGKKQKEHKNNTRRAVQVNIREISKPQLVAQLVAAGVAEQIVKRASFRRAMRKTLEATMAQGALGVKLKCSGRLNGAEIARTEQMKDGALPLHTLDADVDYGFAEAKTTYGTVGVKTWIYKGRINKEKSDGFNA